MTITTFTILACLLATSALAADPPLGTWEWIATEDPAGVFTTPEDLGHTVQREFKSDLTFIEYRDQVPYATGVFSVDDVVFGEVTITRLSIDYGGISPLVCAYGIDQNDQLVMSWGTESPSGLPSFPIERFAVRGVDTVGESWGAVKVLFR